jgi:hypothetical protein
LTEDSERRSALDLVNLTTINALKKRGLLQVHRSSEFSAYPQPFKDAESYWATLYNIYYAIGYNPKVVPPKDTPKDWDDFLDPKWKGKIGMDQEEYEWYAATIQYWGKEKALKFHRVLARPYDDLATDGGRGVSSRNCLRASHRIDEKSWSACGVGQDRGSGIRDSFPRRRGGQGAPSQRGQASDGFYSV